MAVQGTWFGLPDLGATEWLSGGNAPSWANNPAVYQAAGTTQKQYSQDVAQNAQYAAAQQGQAINPYAPYKNTQSSSPITTGGTTNTGGQSGSGAVNNAPPNPYETYVDGRKLADIIEEENRRKQAIRSNIESGFNSIYNTLDSMANLIPQQQTEDYSFLQGKYDTQKQALDTAKTGTLANLDVNRQQVQNRAAQSSADVATNLRNMLKASALQLGATGAGNSSATDVMAPYAYAKLASKNNADISRQANDQFLQIDQKANDVKTTYDTQISSLGTWLNDAQMQVKQYYMNKIDQIKQAKMTADQNKMQALNSLEGSLLAQAQNQLATLDNRAYEYQRSIQQWAMDRMSQLDNYKLQLSNSGSFNPQDILWNEMSALGLNNTQGGNSYANLGVSYGKKKDKYGNVIG